MKIAYIIIGLLVTLTSYFVDKQRLVFFIVIGIGMFLFGVFEIIREKLYGGKMKRSLVLNKTHPTPLLAHSHPHNSILNHAKNMHQGRSHHHMHHQSRSHYNARDQQAKPNYQHHHPYSSPYIHTGHEFLRMRAKLRRRR